MKVSHETPFAYLEQSLSFNDYDYLLPHLYDKHEEYREFFQRENHRKNITKQEYTYIDLTFIFTLPLTWYIYYNPNATSKFFFMPTSSGL